MLKVIEKRVNSVLQRFPVVKFLIKRSYQLCMYALSPKLKSEGNIIKISPDDNMEYFFGYYDKSPWDGSDQYMLSLRVRSTCKAVAPNDEVAEIVIFDTHDNNSYRVLGETRAWNVQQGCMLQWLGDDYKTKIIYNDFRDGEYCSVVLNVLTGAEKVYPFPVYSVAANGEFALSLDFSRLHRLGKGYGYSNLEDLTAHEKIPDGAAIWKLDLNTGEVISVLRYSDFSAFETRPEMLDAEHKVNHILISPNSERFMVLHRWFKNKRMYSRLVTANVDGSGMYNLSDDDMVSHCFWKNNEEIVAYGRKCADGDGYYLMRDQGDEYEKIWPTLLMDGHPSFAPAVGKAVTDTYPNRARVSDLYVIRLGDGEDQIKRVARTFSPFKYDNQLRCDLHPRWNRGGSKICVDATFEGGRGLYVVIDEGL